MNTPPTRWVKICGITNVGDAESAVRAGASAIGLNFVPSSRRLVELDAAREIADAVRGRIEIVGVFADEPLTKLIEITATLGLDRLQLHGAEPAELVAQLPRAFKALGVASAADVASARAFPGELLLLDAKVQGASGGTGQTFDWSLLGDIVSERRIVLAGGLTPDNVQSAVRRVRPHGVDVASGVEPLGTPRQKDPEKVLRFVREARSAD
jgi:phosphoribosylanthranilate isomerase